MSGRPDSHEAAPYYFKYIDLVPSTDILGALETQLDESLGFFTGISEEKSLHRYAPEKWSIRQVLSHVNDTERVFLFRAFWFARGFDSPLPGFDEKICSEAVQADEISWTRHIEEFRSIRLATLSFFRNLPAAAWTRSGIASELPFTVRALAYLTAGHLTHHVGIVRERYL
jgi:DinB superfamily